MLSHFTPRAQRVIILAQEEARRLNHAFLGTEHLLLGIAALGEGVASEILRRLGVDLRKLRLEVERRIGTGDNILLNGDMPFSPRAKRALEYAVEESHQLDQNFVGTEHLLLGLIREEQGEAAKMLEELGVTTETVRNEVMSMLTGNEPAYGQIEAPPSPPPGPGKVMRRTSVKTPMLDEFGRDLTRLASQGKLDPVIGRDHEIQRVIQILTRRTKNNPVLLGDPGVGKTAIINEDLMIPATALVACGIAFFLRAIRAAGQGGTEIGFHAEEAIKLAAQTAKGAASLLANGGFHPEREIDKVTTPQGLTITGLNQMEHHGFSSAMITGIVSSAKRAETIFNKEK